MATWLIGYTENRCLYLFVKRYHKTITNCARIPPAVSKPTSIKETVLVGTKDWCNSPITAQSTTTMKAPQNQRQFHAAAEPPRKARNNKRHRMKYSVTCPAFLIDARIKSASCDEISGTSKDRIFPRNEDVLWGVKVSVDIQK